MLGASGTKVSREGEIFLKQYHGNVPDSAPRGHVALLSNHHTVLILRLMFHRVSFFVHASPSSLFAELQGVRWMP
jgi:hypothetical protein